MRHIYRLKKGVNIFRHLILGPGQKYLTMPMAVVT